MPNYLKHTAAQETFIKDEGTYDTDFLKWKGRVDRNPVLRSILEAKWSAVTNSFSVSGKKGKQATQILENFTGNGKETFTSIMQNLGKISDVCGDSYAEIIFGDVDDVRDATDVPVNLITLPPNNIRQVIKKGRIIRYEEIDGSGKWKPEKIYHEVHDPFGAATHGTSLVESMDHVLLHIDQLITSGSKIMEKLIKPQQIVYTETDRRSEMQKVKTDWNAINNTDTGALFVPKGVIEKVETITVGQYQVMNPKDWYQVLLDIMLMRARWSQLALGTGTQTNEESAQNQRTGMIELVRCEQSWKANNVRKQLLTLMYPDDVPKITFSYAESPAAEKRDLDMKYIDALTRIPDNVLPPQVKAAMISNKQIEMGEIQDGE
jgi:hypothetical protein